MSKRVNRIMTVLLCGAGICAAPVFAELVIVENGVSRAPIVIFEDAPPFTRRAANELAEYIEKTSGARPEVIEGCPDPVPEHAIWVGYQPKLAGLFPEIDFNFRNPEEILIAANGNHLVIAGRDVWDPDHLTVEYSGKTVHGVQQEYGTANAVYTFLQDYLDVRWFWPGDSGIDVLARKTIAFEPFEYRYHPQVRSRQGLFAYSTLRRGAGDWMRYQRLLLDSLGNVHANHAFNGWWERFHTTHPEYFALQPDGTRGGGEQPYPSANTVKLCHSNPGVWTQWLELVAEQLEQNPNQRVFGAAPNDSWNRGHCVCENCRAWDHPEGDLRGYTWKGLSRQDVALSDREVTFANQVARLLKDRYPDKDYYVYMQAYGNSRPGPVAAVPDDNVIVGNVANFFLRTGLVDRGSLAGKTYKQEFDEWSKVAKRQLWRPNAGSPVGWQFGMPEVPLNRTIENIKFVAERGWIGVYVDYIREHWATQAPMYYVMAQLTWNPGQDGHAILEDYYRRAFGPASQEVQAYWETLERLRDAFIDEFGYEAGMLAWAEYYTPERLSDAAALLARAAVKAGAEGGIYRQRVAFVAAGLEITQIITECRRLMERVNQGDDPDGAAVKQVLAHWDRLRELRDELPHAMRWWRFFKKGKTPLYRGSLHPKELPAE